MENVLPIGLDNVFTILLEPGSKFPAELTVLVEAQRFRFTLRLYTVSSRAFAMLFAP